MARTKRVKDFPEGDACPICGSKVDIEYSTPSYKAMICRKCGYWDYIIQP